MERRIKRAILIYSSGDILKMIPFLVMTCDLNFQSKHHYIVKHTLANFYRVVSVY